MVGEADDARLVVEFLNTVDIDEGIDLLATPAGYRQWATAHQLRAGDRRLALELRDALRQLVRAGGATLPQIALEVRTGRDVAPSLVGDDVAGGVLAAAVRLATRGEWRRLKLCPNPICLEAFWDRSKNRSRTWCAMTGCGNLLNARAYRARRRDAQAGLT